MSFEFLKSNVSIDDKCTLVQEKNIFADKYKRNLDYLILNNGRFLNEIIIKEGYGKPFNHVSCKMLHTYQEWNL